MISRYVENFILLDQLISLDKLFICIDDYYYSLGRDESPLLKQGQVMEPWTHICK